MVQKFGARQRINRSVGRAENHGTDGAPEMSDQLGGARDLLASFAVARF